MLSLLPRLLFSKGGPSTCPGVWANVWLRALLSSAKALRRKWVHAENSLLKFPGRLRIHFTGSVSTIF